jgi:phosphatidylinositol alpha-mannosyltransferase
MPATSGPLRLVLVSPYSWDFPGGVQIHVRELAAHLRLRGHEVHILAPGKRVGVRDDVHIVGRAVPVRGNGSVARISFGPLVGREVGRALRTLKPDLIHVHEPLAPSVSMLTVLQANAPVVATFHSNVGRERVGSLWFQVAVPAVRPVWDGLACRIAVSEAARHSVTSRMGEAELEIVPNGVDVERFASAQPLAPAMGRYLLFVGRLESRKGFPIAVQAFERLAPVYPDLRLVVIGEGSQRDAVDELPGSIRARVDMLGRIDDTQLPRYFRSATAYLGPATGGESFGIVLAEAMAAGTPIVASNISGYCDVARNGKEAILVAPGEPDSLALGIRRLLETPGLADSLRAAGKIRAQDYAWDRVTDRIEGIYRRALNQRPGA